MTKARQAMKSLTIFMLAVLLVGCSDSSHENKQAVEKAAAPELLKGRLVKSPVLDYRKYAAEPAPTGEPGKTAAKAAPGAKSMGSGFKKSPVLDYRKYLGEDGKP